MSPTAVPLGARGVEKANYISEMWAKFYAGALLTDAAAADFQLAIWGVLQGSISGGIVATSWAWLEVGDHSGADSLIKWTNENNGVLAYDVVGFNPVNGISSQAYAVQGVPDGGMTLMLLVSALVRLGALRRKFNV